MKTKDPIIITGIIAIIILLTLGITAIIQNNIQSSYDRFYSIIVILITLYLHKKINITKPAITLGAIILLAHNLGLYGNTFILPFDYIIHLASGIFLALVFYPYFKSTHKRKLTIITLTILISIGIGSLLEIIEFIGFSFLGEGEGILLYGKGDWGEWNNVSWDLINNTIGALITSTILTIKNAIKKK